MPNNTAITSLHELLCPARRKLHQFQVKNAFIAALNQTAWIVPVMSASWFVVLTLAVLGGISITKLQPWGWLVVLGIAVLWPVAIYIRMLFRQPNWTTVTSCVDDATNPHNLVTIAHEHSRLDTPSLFARVAIHRGIELLKSVVPCELKIEYNRVAVGRMLKGAGIAAVLWTASIWLPQINIHSESRDGHSVVLQSGEMASPSQSLSREIQTSEQSPASKTGKTNSPSSHLQTVSSAMRDIPVSPKSSGGKFAGADLANGRAGQSSTTLSSGTVSARNQEGAKENSDSSKPSRKERKSGVFSEEKNMADSSSSSPKGSAGLSPNAESDIKAAMASGGIEELTDQDEANWDQEEQNQGSPASSGLRPQLSDKQSAPSRELGLSGKPGDKAGDGRGGPGLIKKSRATASELSAATVSVHVKGQMQPGKSKSYTQSLPLSAVEYRPSVSDAGNSSANEGDVLLYIPDPQWKPAIEKYFLNLRKEDFK